MVWCGAVWCGVVWFGVVVLGGMQVLAFTAGHWCFWVGRRNRPKQRNSKKIRGNQTVPGPGVGLPRRGEEGSGTGTGTGTGTKLKNRTFTQGEEKTDCSFRGDDGMMEVKSPPPAPKSSPLGG